MGRMCDADPSIVADKTILELGAGAAVPSIIAATLGAHTVVKTRAKR